MTTCFCFGFINFYLNGCSEKRTEDCLNGAYTKKNLFNLNLTFWQFVLGIILFLWKLEQIFIFKICTFSWFGVLEETNMFKICLISRTKSKKIGNFLTFTKKITSSVNCQKVEFQWKKIWSVADELFSRFSTKCSWKIISKNLFFLCFW